jgi:Flp pilus assembly protein TadD
MGSQAPGSTGTGPLIVIAIDGLERCRFDLLRRSGKAPNLAELARTGTVASIDVPPPRVADSFWTTLATGQSADAHGVLHAYELSRPSGFARTLNARAVRVPTLWQLADDAALTTALVGWPATAQLALVHGGVAAPSIEVVLEQPVPACPMPPDLLSLGDRSVDVGSLRLHPEESESIDLDALLDRIERAQDAGRRSSSVRCIAETATLHAIATRWLAERAPRLLAVRLPLLGRLAPIWEQVSARAADEIAARALQWLDRLIGRYLAIGGAHADLVVIGSGILQSPADDESGQRPCADAFVLATSGAAAPLRARLRGAPAIGLAALGDHLRAELGLAAAPLLPRRAAIAHGTRTERGSIDIFSVPERAVLDASTRGVAGLAALDFSAALAFARRIERETRLALAEVRLHAGDRDGAGEALERLTARYPDYEPGLILRGCAMLEAGRGDDCAALLQRLVPRERDDVYGVAARGLTAFAAGDWELAEASFTELRERWASFIEPLPWLAAIALQAGRWSIAEARYRGLAACRPRDVTVAEGLAIAQLAQGHGADALATLDLALQIAPARPSLMLLRSVAAERTGQRMEAIDEMLGVVAPDSARAAGRRALSLATPSRP